MLGFIAVPYVDVLLKILPDDLPLITAERAPIPPDAPKFAAQGRDEPRKPDAD